MKSVKKQIKKLKDKVEILEELLDCAVVDWDRSEGMLEDLREEDISEKAIKYFKKTFCGD